MAILLVASLFAKETDVYFANGVLTSEKEAKKNAKMLEEKLNRPDVPKVYVAYNHTFDSYFVKGGPDFYESLLQKLSIIKKLDEWLSNDERVTAHKFDLDKQLAQYRITISSGKKVLVVAHSQGNLFTNDAYESLKEEGLGDQFDAVSVASPMFSDIKEDTKTFSWDIDVVADLALNPLRKRYYCEVRKVEWIKNRVYPSHKKPKVNYIYDLDKEKVLQGDWIPKEPFIARFDTNVHAFAFYMGNALRDGDGNILQEPFEQRELKTDYLKDKILSEVNRIIDANKQLSSGNDNTNANPTSGGTDNSNSNNTTSNTDTSGSNSNTNTGSTDNSSNANNGGTTTPPDASSFDYKSECSSIDFPDPIPSDLETSINDAIANAGSSVATVICQAIGLVVQGYNATHGGGVTGGGSIGIP